MAQRGGYEVLDDAIVVRTTDAAVLVNCAGVEHWIPRSVCMDGDTLSEHDTDICVRSWFVDKESIG
jgi:hypothetical protein